MTAPGVVKNEDLYVIGDTLDASPPPRSMPAAFRWAYNVRGAGEWIWAAEGISSRVIFC